MSNEYKLVPVEPTEEMIQVGCESYFDSESSVWSAMAGAYKAMLAVAPQPPALGGEPEVKRYSLIGKCLSENATGEGGAWMKYADHRNVVAPLQAEIERLQSLSVTNIMMDVIPGDGSGHEVFAKSVREVEEAISTQYYALENVADERDQLQARCDELEKHHRRYEWIRSQGTKWSELSPALFERVNDECNPPYMALKFGEELDSSIDTCISRAALSKPAGSEKS